METIQINISIKQQKILVILVLVLYGLFEYAYGMETGYNDGFSDAVEICASIIGEC